MTRIDRAALKECYRLACAESADRRDQMEAMARERGWQAAAEFACRLGQRQNLRVRPWAVLPMQVDDIEGALAAASKPDARGTAAAARLLQLMLAAGLSRFDPHPGRVLASG